MRKFSAFSVLLVSGGVSAALAQDAPLPTKVHIEVVNALIGPCKVDGTHWDGPGHCSKEVKDGLSKLAANKVIGVVAGAATALNPYAIGLELAQKAAPSILEKESKPDPYGWVEVAVNDAWQDNLKWNLFSPQKPDKDNFNPQFPTHDVVVPFDRGTRLRITLFDKDLTKSDDIGKAEISYDEMVEALKAGKIYEVMVADQTQNQLLFVGIDVRPAHE